MLRRALTFLGIYVAVSAIATLFLLLILFPDHPNSWLGWLVLFIVAVPIILVGEGIGKFLYGNPLARAVDAKTAKRSFSWLRISFMLVSMLLFVALELVALRWLGLLHHGWPAP
jgi:hypothetical protein